MNFRPSNAAPCKVPLGRPSYLAPRGGLTSANCALARGPLLSGARHNVQFLTTNTEYNREPHFTELSHVDWHRYVSFNGSRVEIKRHAAYAGNYFTDLSALELLSVESDLLDNISYDNIIDIFISAKKRKCL